MVAVQERIIESNIWMDSNFLRYINVLEGTLQNFGLGFKLLIFIDTSDLTVLGLYQILNVEP